MQLNKRMIEPNLNNWRNQSHNYRVSLTGADIKVIQLQEKQATPLSDQQFGKKSQTVIVKQLPQAAL